MGAIAQKINRLETEIFELADEIEHAPYLPKNRVFDLKQRIDAKRAQLNTLNQNLEIEIEANDYCAGFAPA